MWPCSLQMPFPSLIGTACPFAGGGPEFVSAMTRLLCFFIYCNYYNIRLYRENMILEGRISTSSAEGFTLILNILGELFLCFLGHKRSHKSVQCSTFLLCSKNDKNVLLDLKGS